MKDEIPETVCNEVPQAYVRLADQYRKELSSGRKQALEDARVVAMEMFSEFMPGTRGVALAIEMADRIVDAICGVTFDSAESG